MNHGAVAGELFALGVRVTAEDDFMRIDGGPVEGGSARSHGDHRIAMAVAAAAVAGRVYLMVAGLPVDVKALSEAVRTGEQ